MRAARALGSLLSVLVPAVAIASCTGTTGDELVTFPAYAAGAVGAAQPFTINGFSVALTVARMHIGALYLDEAPLPPGGDGPVCIAPGVYAAQVPGGVDVDLMSSAPQEFSVYGNGTADLGQSWSIWLTDGDINEVNTAHMVDLQGVATRISDGALFPFGAIVTINQNRLIPVSDPSQPGLNPLCKQRIVNIGGADITLFSGGSMTVRVDPRKWFNLGLDFSTLPLATSASCQLDPDSDYGGATYCIPDTNFATGLGASQGQRLFTGILTGGAAAYSLDYSASP